MKMNLIVIPNKGFSEEDIYYFIKILDGSKYIATPDNYIAIGKYKSKIVPDFSIEELLDKDIIFDRIIFIADKGYKILLKYPEVLALFTRYKTLRKTVILSSLAQYLFAKERLIYDMIITYNKEEFPEYYDKFSRYKLKIVDYPFVLDKGIITVKGRDSILDLELHLNELEKEMNDFYKFGIAAGGI